MRFKNNILKITAVITKHLKLKPKKYVFYIATLFGIGIFLINGLITRGNSFYYLFSPDKKDYFMDFFNVLHSLFHGPYSYGFIYPPLPLLVYRLLLRFIPYNLVESGPFFIRATQAGEIVFIFYFLITLLLFFALIMEVKKGARIEKYLFTFIILFSSSFIHQFERANIIFVALLFLMSFVFYKDSKNRILRELAIISLAVAVGIKLYPAIFGLILLKEKRFNEFLRLVLYCLCMLIGPFFFIGGISQLPIFLDNLIHTSNYSVKWGLGYSVNLQNIVRIFFGLAGNFSDLPITLGRYLSFLLLIVGIYTAFISKVKWKIVAIIMLLMILVPPISYEYVLIFMVIPLIMFLDHKKKEPLGYLYLICFILLFVPLTFGKITAINIGFGNPALPLTYGVLIQNISLLVMMAALIDESFRLGFMQKFFVFSTNLLKIIYDGKHKLIKVLITCIVIFVIFGDDMFSVIYVNFFKRQISSYTFSQKLDKSLTPYILRIEPYYLHYGDKVVIQGRNFNSSSKNYVKLKSNYGEINEVEYISSEELIFSIPLHWRLGKTKIWAEETVVKTGKTQSISNDVEIDLLDRLTGFNKEDVEYFSQIKYLDPEVRYVNSFTNYKLRQYRFSRWIPTKVFQLYADIIELKNRMIKSNKRI